MIFFEKTACEACHLHRYHALPMSKITPLIAVVTASFLTATAVSAATSGFSYKDKNGRTHTVSVITKYRADKIQHPLAKIDKSINPKLMKAATIAQERANAHSRSQCWHYVKEALLASGASRQYE